MDVERQIAGLPQRSRADLLDLWEELYGRAPPSKISRNLLLRSIAYKIQEGEEGGLSPATKRRLARLAEEIRLRGDAALTSMPRIKPGTLFVREWQGTFHQVSVTTSGFEWQGRVHRSLSEIARAITGTRWNGWTFFGARRGGKNGAAVRGSRSASLAMKVEAATEAGTEARSKAASDQSGRAGPEVRHA